MSPASTNKNIPKLFDPLLIRGLELHNRNLVSSAWKFVLPMFPGEVCPKKRYVLSFFASVVLENLEIEPSWYVEIKIKHLSISNSGVENFVKVRLTWVRYIL